MAKSSGNIIRIGDLAEMGFDPLAYRYVTFQTRYRSEMDFTEDALRAADTHLKRLRRIEGQVRGFARLVEQGAYCIDVLTQVSAAPKAPESVALSLLEEHLSHCVPAPLHPGGEGADQKNSRNTPGPAPPARGPRAARAGARVSSPCASGRGVAPRPPKTTGGRPRRFSSRGWGAGGQRWPPPPPT